MKQPPNGMRVFLVIWIGQFASFIGTAMTTFAMTLWAYETTGRVTPLAMIQFCFVIPIVIMGPFMGVSDIAAAASYY